MGNDHTALLARLLAFVAWLVAVSYVAFAWRYSLSVEPLAAVLFWLWNVLAMAALLVLAVVVVSRT